MSSGSSLPREQQGVGHARHGVGLEALAPTVARGLGAEERGRMAVLHVPGEHAVANQGRCLGRIALVVHVDGAPGVVQGGIVDHGAQLAGDALANAAGVVAGLLAIEVGFKSVANRFVEQDPTVAGCQHDSHLARRAQDAHRTWRWACRTASSACFSGAKVSKYSRPIRPPPPDEPLWRLPSCSTMARTANRSSGWRSWDIRPSLVATRISRSSSVSEASTRTTRGSAARAALSARSRMARLPSPGASKESSSTG